SRSFTVMNGNSNDSDPFVNYFMINMDYERMRNPKIQDLLTAAGHSENEVMTTDGRTILDLSNKIWDEAKKEDREGWENLSDRFTSEAADNDNSGSENST
ncbi:10424_t:CDS:2, partial [Acaulospora colombiana]